MSEIITTYKLTDLDQAIPMDRKEFYESQVETYKKTGKPTRATEIVQVLLFTKDKKIILQKRSAFKNHNPLLFDKSMGGHVKWNDSVTYSVLVECMQELGIPSIIIDSTEDFVKTKNLLVNYTKEIAVIQYIDSHTYNSKKIINDEMVQIANKYHLYFGIYNGPARPADKEASGLLYYAYDDLENEIKKAPGLYTEDLKFFIKKYHKKITEFLKILD